MVLNEFIGHSTTRLKVQRVRDILLRRGGQKNSEVGRLIFVTNNNCAAIFGNDLIAFINLKIQIRKYQGTRFLIFPVPCILKTTLNEFLS